MNKLNMPLLFRATAATVVGILVLSLAVRHPEYYGANVGWAVHSLLSVLTFPIRIYSLLGWDDSLLALLVLMATSGLFWGLVVERLVWVLRLRRHDRK